MATAKTTVKRKPAAPKAAPTTFKAEAIVMTSVEDLVKALSDRLAKGDTPIGGPAFALHSGWVQLVQTKD